METTMTTDNTTDVISELSMIDALRQMLKVLEKENSALLKGDGILVGELAEEKLRLSGILEQMTPPAQSVAAEIRRLGQQVRDLANSNHLLIEHMHQYYTGIMTLMIKMNGQTQTYGQNGYINRPTRTQAPTRREIIA